jgi:putative ABC transport system ATP-binding protein
MGDKMIETKSLSKEYISGKIKVPALKDVSVKINKGEFVAIMGASGSGKSTLLRQLGLLDRPTQGKFYLDGLDTSGIKESFKSAFRLRYLGYIFQEYALLEELNALENVYLPLLMADEKEDIGLKKAGKILDSLGLGDKMWKTKDHLSGGEQQRVAIARALVNNPKVLLADEPCANLDSKNSKQILELLKKLNKELKQTIIMVTHEEWHTKYVDRILILGDGKLIEDKKV